MTRNRDTFDMFQREDRGRFGDNESVRGNDDKLQSVTVTMSERFAKEKGLV